MNVRAVVIAVALSQVGVRLLAIENPGTDVVVNRGRNITNSRVIEIDASRGPYPQLLLSLDDPWMTNPVVFHDLGKPLSVELPERDGQHNLFMRFADANGKPVEPIIFKVIELDTIPPVVEITSPTNSAVTDQGFVHVQATVFDPLTKDRAIPRGYRRVSTWINGERFWDRKGSSI